MNTTDTETKIDISRKYMKPSIKRWPLILLSWFLGFPETRLLNWLYFMYVALLYIYNRTIYDSLLCIPWKISHQFHFAMFFQNAQSYVWLIDNSLFYAQLQIFHAFSEQEQIKIMNKCTSPLQGLLFSRERTLTLSNASALIFPSDRTWSGKYIM